MYSFDAKKVKEEVVTWIRDWFEKNGEGCPAVVAISGGKDSSVVAALCVEALGKDRVIGVLLPNGTQHDIDVSQALVKHLDIKNYTIDISGAFSWIKDKVSEAVGDWSIPANTNLPPRVRMSVTYAVSQVLGGRVANTCNLSEDWVGYATKYGDAAGDFSPLSTLTVQEVKAIGRECGLPSMFVDKVPIDGLQAKTDEDNLGFTYVVLDKYIRTGEIDDAKIKEKIDRMHRNNLFKLKPMEKYDANILTFVPEK